MWKPIPSTDNYEASDDGRIRRIGGKPLSPLVDASGYEVVSVKEEGEFRQRRVNRMVAEAFFGPAPSGKHEAAHGDGNRRNSCVSNLRWATRSENQRDRLTHGTHMRGERGYGACFTDEQAEAIREVLERTGVSNSELGRELGVSHETIRAIRLGKTYREAA